MGGVTRRPVPDAQAGQRGSLYEAAASWQAAAMDVHAFFEMAVRGVAGTHEVWTGSAAEVARADVLAVCGTSDALRRAMVLAAVAARDAAEQIAQARTEVLDLVSA